MATTYTVAQYKTWVKNKLGDPSFDDATLTQLVGDANMEICNSAIWDFMEVPSYSATLTSGTNTFTQPSNLQAMLNFEILSPTSKALYLDYMPHQEFVQRYPNPAILTASQPSIWTTFGGALIFGPANADQNYTVQERYIKAPSAPTSDSAVLDVPDDFRELMVLGVYARGLEVADQPDYAATQYKLFEKQLGLMKIRRGQRQLGTPLVIQTRRSLLRGLPRGR